MAKEHRLTSEELLGDIDKVEISFVMWEDKKSVTLLFSFTGESLFYQIKRFDKKEKMVTEISYPNLVKDITDTRVVTIYYKIKMVLAIILSSH